MCPGDGVDEHPHYTKRSGDRVRSLGTKTGLRGLPSYPQSENAHHRGARGYERHSGSSAQRGLRVHRACSFTSHHAQLVGSIVPRSDLQRCQRGFFDLRIAAALATGKPTKPAPSTVCAIAPGDEMSRLTRASRTSA